MTPLNTIIEEEKKFDALFPCIDPTCDQNGTAVTGSSGEPEPMQCEYCYRERLPPKELFTTAIQRAYEAGKREVLELERAYWVNVFDSAPVRETEHPHDIVARNFARIEIDRLDTLLSKIRS